MENPTRKSAGHSSRGAALHRSPASVVSLRGTKNGVGVETNDAQPVWTGPFHYHANRRCRRGNRRNSVAMSGFDQIITSLAVFGLGISAVIAYLKINKIWARRHIKEVAESVSVAAALLSLFTTLPFLIKFLVIDEDYVAAAKFVLSLLVFVVFFLVGIGLWVRSAEPRGFWSAIRNALLTEQKELTNLLHTLAQPREARAIVRILQLVSTVDRELDQREIDLLESIAKPLGVAMQDLASQQSTDSATVEQVRQAFVDYLALKPVAHQASKTYDLVRFMVRADKQISSEERLILDELASVVRDYLGRDAHAPLFEVLVVPQNDQQKTYIGELLPQSELVPKSGGQAVVAGRFYSEAFALDVCRQYRDKGLFCTVARQQ